MSTRTPSATAAAAVPAEQVHDRRRFWRLLLAGVTAIPMLAKGVFIS
jgi:hypothetical protein